MANTKVSQLPIWSGTAADLRWFIMNNSGETETFKFSGYTSPLKAGTGTDSAVSLNLTPSYAPSANMFVFGNHSAVSSGDESAVLGGKNNKTESAQGAVVGGLSNTAGFRCFVGGGYNNYANGNAAAILGGENNLCSNVSQGGIFGAVQNSLYGGNDVANNMFGGYQNRLVLNGSQGITMLGGSENRWHQFDGRNADTRRSYGCMISGYANRIEGLTADSNGAHAYPLLMGGTLNKIFGAESDDTGTTGATIINSFTSTIKNSLYSAHIDCQSSTISGKTQAVMIGCSGRTADASNTTYVENLRVFRQAQYGNYNNGNKGTSYTIDWNNGNIQKVVLTGNTTFSATNITDGTTYIFKVSQDATGNRTATWSSGIFKFANGAPPTLSTGANAVDIFTFVAMDGLLYGVAQLNFG